MTAGIFSDEHAMLRKSIRVFVEKEVAPHVRAWEDAGQIPRTFWRRLGALGFLGLEFPTEYGGGGGDFLSSVVLGEEMARCRSGGVAFSVLVHTDMSSPWLTRFGTDAQKRKYLPRIISGESVCALAITEPGTGSDMAELAFVECPVPAANLLGTEGRGFQQLAEGLQRERLMAAVLALSGATQALEDTIAYLRERTAFGEPLAARQALRHRVADLATELEAARQLVYRAATLYAAGEECVTEVSMAKLFATEVANHVAYDAVQMHGGYGYMREFPVEGFFRDVRLWTIASGTSEVMREIITKRLL